MGTGTNPALLSARKPGRSRKASSKLDEVSRPFTRLGARKAYHTKTAMYRHHTHTKPAMYRHCTQHRKLGLMPQTELQPPLHSAISTTKMDLTPVRKLMGSKKAPPLVRVATPFITRRARPLTPGRTET